MDQKSSGFSPEGEKEIEELLSKIAERTDQRRKLLAEKQDRLLRKLQADAASRRSAPQTSNDEPTSKS